MDNFKRIDTTKLYKPFLTKVLELVEECNKVNKIYIVTNGLRTFQEQEKLYNQGRILPGPVVTNARPGYSYHCYGLAIDVAFDTNNEKPGLQPSWSEKDLRFIADKAISMGLQSGLYFKTIKDAPHIQFNINQFNLKIEDLLKIFLANNKDLLAVWKFLDEKTNG